jgi:tyrosinase
MSKPFRHTRRDFLVTAAAAAGATALPLAPSRAAAKYRRYNVMSPEGQKMLRSYAKGVQAMLDLPASDPRNWFRNAFIHLMDCPHGNWWFYVWHRGYLGYFEHTIRALSGDDGFAIPYWDWTTTPQIPDAMFDGVLTPTDKAYERYTGNLARFTSFIQPELTKYWGTLSRQPNAQRDQLAHRGYKEFDDLWNAVTGLDLPNPTPPPPLLGLSGDQAFAITCGARYLSRDNAKLDAKTTTDVSATMILSGLQVTNFYNPVEVPVDEKHKTLYLSFTSSKTESHGMQPSGNTYFSTLEAFPHNKVHNYIGGVGQIDPGPYGNMTNFLSPVDPIFFLHHSNMDRLWDVWTRKQQALHLPYLPTGKDLEKFSDEPFLFYVDTRDGKEHYVGSSKAGDYLSTDVFDYDYEPGFGEVLVKPPSLALVAEKAAPPVEGTVKGNVGSVVVPRAMFQGAAIRPRMAAVTIARPGGISTAREFDVYAGETFLGTFAFFGPMMAAMKMSAEASFAVPLPRTLRAFTALGAANNAPLEIRVVPAQGQGAQAPVLKAFRVGVL